MNNNNNLEDWLQSLGFTDNSHDAGTTIVNTSPEAIEAAIEAASLSDSSSADTIAQSLSEEDFNDILDDLGFEEVPDAEAEEIYDENATQEERGEEGEDTTEEYDERGNEDRDLDAEENADGDALEQAGVITPVTEHNIVYNPETEQYQEDNHNGNVRNIESEEVTVLSGSPERTEPLLPENSPTLLMDDSTSRFSGTEWFMEIQKQRIILAGCGGIGSNLAFQLARMHPDGLFLYDDDIVEQVNMSGQLFSRDDVGKSKVDAVADMIYSYTSTTHIFAHIQKFTESSIPSNIMMCGFDNMSARKIFFNKWHEHVRCNMPPDEQKRCLFMDGRLSIDTLQIFCLTGDDTYNIERYANNYLFSDEDADETICSMKQTTYLACMIGSLMTNLFTNFVANLLNPVIPYDLPFFTEYDAQNMIFKTEN